MLESYQTDPTEVSELKLPRLVLEEKKYTPTLADVPKDLLGTSTALSVSTW